MTKSDEWIHPTEKKTRRISSKSMAKNVIWTEKSDTERNGWKKEASKIQYMATVWAVSAIVSIVLNRNRKKMLFCNVTLCTAKSFDYRERERAAQCNAKLIKMCPVIIWSTIRRIPSRAKTDSIYIHKKLAPNAIENV